MGWGSDVHRRLLLLFGSLFDVLLNRRGRTGMTFSIDSAYSHVTADYIFHCQVPHADGDLPVAYAVAHRRGGRMIGSFTRRETSSISQSASSNTSKMLWLYGAATTETTTCPLAQSCALQMVCPSKRFFL